MAWSGSRKSLGIASARRRLTRSVAAMTAAGLLATLAAQAPAGANEAPTAPDSEVAAAQASSSVDPAAEQARESGERVEITAERGADSTTFINPDGTTTVEITEEPTRLQQDGQWVEIDPSLAPEDGVLVPAATEADVEISDGRGDGNSEALATVVEGNKSLSLDWPTDLPAAQVAGEEATFDAGRTRDVQVTATNGGFNVHVILDKAPVTQPEYRLPITARGVSLSKTDSGSFVARDANGEPVFWIARPVMWDATQEGLEAGPEQVVDVDAALDTEGDGRQVLVLRPSMEFLADPATVYPVRVDPDVYTDSSADRTTYVTTLDPLKGFSTDSYLRVGYTDSLKRNRAYIQHEIPDRPGTVIDAKLRLYQYDTRSCTPSTLDVYPVAEKWRATDHDDASGPEAGVWWKTPDPTSSALKHRQPEINTSSAYAASKAFAHGMSGCGNDSEDIDVTDIVNAWDEDRLANNGLALRANDTNDAAYKAFCSKNVNPSGTSCYTTSRVPTLIVTYNTDPAVPSNLSPSSAVTGTLMPELSGTIAGAPDVTFFGEFEVLDAVTNQRVTEEAYLVGSSTGGSGVSIVEVDEETLQPGTMYKWRMRASNGSMATAWTAYQSFSTTDQVANSDMTLNDASGAMLDCEVGSARVLVTSPTPALNARVRDVDFIGGAEATRAEFEIRALEDDAPLASGISPVFTEGSSGSWSVPADVLQLDRPYRWRARAATTETTPAGTWSTDCELQYSRADEIPIPPAEYYRDTPEGNLQRQQPETDEDSVTVQSAEEACTAEACMTFVPGEPFVDPTEEPTVEIQSDAPKWTAACEAKSGPWVKINRRSACALRNVKLTTTNPPGYAYGVLKSRMWLNGTTASLRNEVRIFPPPHSSPNLMPNVMTMNVFCGDCSGSAFREVLMSWEPCQTDPTCPGQTRVFHGQTSFPFRAPAIGTKFTTNINMSFAAQTPNILVTSNTFSAAEARCDAIIGTKPGCVFASYTPSWKLYSFLWSDVSVHINQALRAGLPGSLVGGPLTRLMDKSKIRKNRRTACPSGTPVRPSGFSCDEYPFASTYQGASTATRSSGSSMSGSAGTFSGCDISSAITPWVSSKTTGWTHCMVSKGHNSGEGGGRSQFFKSERILDGDKFYVVYH